MLRSGALEDLTTECTKAFGQTALEQFLSRVRQEWSNLVDTVDAYMKRMRSTDDMDAKSRTL